MSHHPSGHSKQKKSKNSEEDQTKQKKMDSHKESTQSSIPNGNKSEKENLKTLNHGSVSNKEKTESKEGKESNEKKESIESKENDSNERKVPVDVRVAVIGNVDSGKSTMIGVLTSGDLDDGRGKARSRILKHNHERSNGRTSCMLLCCYYFSQYFIFIFFDIIFGNFFGNFWIWCFVTLIFRFISTYIGF